ncbi:Fc.00g060870.m01.CDS01 [Cosmosporella sp. VM-42]
MTSVRTAVLAILGISFMVFVAFFGRLPALRRTPIAALHRVIWVHIPNAVLAVDQVVTGGRVSRYLMWFGNYLMHERHWSVVIFFLLILTIGEYLYLPEVWHQIGAFTKVTAAITVILPYLFLYLACSSDPGYITPENLPYYLSLYPYDHTLFHPGHECRTCRILKPARSKHCSICKKCVAKADHHCIFINSCVGYGNQHYFVLLLLSTAVLTTYGGILGMSLLADTMKLRTPRWTIWPPKDMTTNQYLAVWGWAIQDNVNLGASTLLALLTSPLVWGLLLYTIWLIYCGTTTNETLKWSECKDDMADGLAFRRSMAANREKNEGIEPRWTRWPVETEQILVTNLDGQPPPNGQRMPGDGPWERVWNLRQVENLYDMGFWDNLLDVFVADYTFGGKDDEPVVEQRQRKR